MKLAIILWMLIGGGMFLIGFVMGHLTGQCDAMEQVSDILKEQLDREDDGK